MASLLDRLNPPQKDAATTIDGPLLVLAGAGTGKTSVITTRIAYMIQQGVAPSSILGVTFTNKAAKEMRERLNRIVPVDAARKVTLGTFHSFCSRVLRRDIHLVGTFNSKFSIADDSDQKSILRQAAAELGYSKDDAPTATRQQTAAIKIRLFCHFFCCFASACIRSDTRFSIRFSSSGARLTSTSRCPIKQVRRKTLCSMPSSRSPALSEEMLFSSSPVSLYTAANFRIGAAADAVSLVRMMSFPSASISMVPAIWAPPQGR